MNEESKAKFRRVLAAYADDLSAPPIERAWTIPSDWFTDETFFNIDRELVISRSWQYIGPAERVREHGQYLTADIAGNPIVVVRDKDGILRGFYNVCRHRGGPLVTEEHGCVKALQCKYHGWTYWLDGMLRGVPEFDRVDLFDKKDYGLIPVAVCEWQGLLFISLDEQVPPIEEFFSGIRERIAPADLMRMQFHQRISYDIACNWKVYVDNYLEGYHVPIVHPELNKLIDYRRYVTETFRWYSLQYTPFLAEENFYSQGEGEAFYYFVYPNIMLNILPDRLQTNLVIPTATDRCRVIFDYYYKDTVSPGARDIIAEDMRYSDEIQQEDIEICEQVQRGLNSQAYDRGRYSVKRETGVYHFHALIREAYGRILS